MEGDPNYRVPVPVDLSENRRHNCLLWLKNAWSFVFFFFFLLVAPFDKNERPPKGPTPITLFYPILQPHPSPNYSLVTLTVRKT